MIAFAEYLLKVILCSALLTGYYWFALRNKLFHAWNRFYLLASVVIAIGLPFVKITYLQKEQQQIQPAYQVLQTLTTDEVWFEEATTTATVKQSFFSAENISIGLYLFVSFITLIILLIAIFRIIRMIKKYQHWKINNLVFVDTDARGTPFSFLRFVFWNREIDFHSEQGQQIFAHELVHVKQKHSWDKLFINTVLIIFWSNPFFWLIRKELTMIHEFIADQQSVKDHDTASFAAMILATAFPGYNMPLTNPFFYSPVKRRLLMLTKLQNPKIGYISRLLLLPLLTFLVVACSVKTKEKAITPNASNKIFTEKENHPKSDTTLISIANEFTKTLYLGTDNRLVISTGKIAADEIIVTSNNGVIQKEDDQWIAQPASQGEAIITIASKTAGKTTVLQKFTFTVKNIPDPVITLAGSRGGRMSTAKFKSTRQLDIDDEWEIKGFVLYATGAGFDKPVFKQVYDSNVYNGAIISLMSRIGPGTTITYDEVIVKMKKADVRKVIPGIFVNLY